MGLLNCLMLLHPWCNFTTSATVEHQTWTEDAASWHININIITRRCGSAVARDRQLWAAFFLISFKDASVKWIQLKCSLNTVHLVKEEVFPLFSDCTDSVIHLLTKTSIYRRKRVLFLKIWDVQCANRPSSLYEHELGVTHLIRHLNWFRFVNENPPRFWDSYTDKHKTNTKRSVTGVEGKNIQKNQKSNWSHTVSKVAQFGYPKGLINEDLWLHVHPVAIWQAIQDLLP